MATSNTRRTAADARRIAEGAGELDSKETVAKLREALTANYQRGVEDGREQLQAELGASDSRCLALEILAEQCDTTHSRLSSVPNSGRALSALREAAALLRDASSEGEPPAPAEPEQGKAKAASKKATKAAKKN
jgi:hypothetical protein